MDGKAPTAHIGECSLKLAILFDVQSERAKEFMQRIEDVANEFEGRIIYSIHSQGPIKLIPIGRFPEALHEQRLVPPAETGKYPPTYTGVGPVEKDRGVNHASARNERWRMDLYNRGVDCPHRDCIGFDADSPEQVERLQPKRPNVWARLGYNRSASHRNRHPSSVRFRVPPDGGKRKPTLQAAPLRSESLKPTVSYYVLDTLCGMVGQPSFLSDEQTSFLGGLNP